MGDTKFTLVELHLDGDTQFGPGSIGNALPFGSSTESEETPEYETETDIDDSADEESGGSKAIGAVVALVVLVAIAAAAKKFSGDDEDDLEAEEEPDVIVN
ncbi:hypothetical protein HT576_19475 [Haloterrigena sp. SYSU A121-1]|uniref:Uncharacterized protein n=1 Tax=Haloterrigena gelatinilytica TaxID=2741724 RepID=A0A8J8KD69_9EURY|nr:hypothetical protein [Haloterrigena gelatinilytica]NUB93190.1 hypothetical protein [Haloterrigena gelatinilytica]